MIGYIRYKWELAWLQRSMRQVTKTYSEEVRKAREKKAGREAIEGILHTQRFEEETIDEQIKGLQTQRLLVTAGKLMVPYPDLSDEERWAEGNKAVYRYLTVIGMNELRGKIRAERKSNWELVAMWLPGLTGVIGAITGLVAVLGKAMGP
jgi:hypothetical protein